MCHLLDYRLYPYYLSLRGPEYRLTVMSTMPERTEEGDEAPELPGTDRDRGIITENDREWLAGEREYSNKGGRWKVKNRVKDRLLEATRDFEYLERMPDDDRREVFQEERDGSATYRQYDLDDEISDSVLAAVGFYLRTADDADIPPEEFLEGAFQRGLPGVAEANVAVDLRDEDGEVLRTFDVEDGTIVHQENGPGALDRATVTEEIEDEADEEVEDVGVLQEAYRSIAAAGKQVGSTLIEAAFYVYIIAFGFLMYEQYGLAATVATFTAIGVLVWLLSQAGDWIRSRSEKDDATLLDGVRAGLGREDVGEDGDETASTDGGASDQTPAQEAA